MITDVIALASLIFQIILTVTGWMRIPGHHVNSRVFGQEVTRSKAQALLATPAITLILVVTTLSRGGTPSNPFLEVMASIVMIFLATIHYLTVLRAMEQ